MFLESCDASPMTVAELNDDFRDMFTCLIEQGVDYVVVGAHALAMHGIPRATGDIDILVRPSADNAARVVRALERFGAPLEAHGIAASDFEREGNVYQVGLPPRRIDLLTSITGVDIEDAFRTRVEASVGALRLQFIGRAALLQNKRATDRPKDRADVIELEKLGR